ncbi:Hypothetical protein A7982_11683 [Minicystis rosea]|nr:Hypothetical protein A7982_11683 [Minicystis rosea]
MLSYWSASPSSERSSYDWHRIEIHLTRSELEALLGAEYADLRRELADDFARFPPKDPDERALVAHATLHDLVENAPGSLQGVIRDFLWHDLLARLFASNAAGDLRYWICDLVGMTMEAESIVLTGEASSRPASQRS